MQLENGSVTTHDTSDVGEAVPVVYIPLTITGDVGEAPTTRSAASQVQTPASGRRTHAEDIAKHERQCFCFWLGSRHLTSRAASSTHRSSILKEN